MLLLGGLWLAVRVLAGVPDLGAALLVVAVGALIALPLAWALAVARGHKLGQFTPGGWLRWLMGGPVLRLGVAGLGGALAAVLLLLRLVEAGPVLWGLVALAFPLTWVAMVWLAPWGRSEKVRLHARRLVHRAAVALCGAVLVFMWLLSGWVLPAPDLAPFEPPAAAGPLVAEALALARLWAGLEAYALGQAAAFGAWGWGLALLVAVFGQLSAFAAAATLAVALALPGREWSRALAVASDAADPPPMGRAGPFVAVVLCLALIGLATTAGRWLFAEPPGQRPAARVMQGAERIGDAFYRPGTHEQLLTLRAQVAAQDAALVTGLEQAMEAGFDTMEANVDAFLDRYYSLGAEYLRLINMFRLEAHLERQLRRTLTDGGALQAAQHMLESAGPEVEARHEALRASEAALMARNRLAVDNPALLRLGGSFDPLPELRGRFAQELRTAQLRWAGAGGAGLLTAAIASRVAQRLAARGVLRVAARGLMRVAGLLVAVVVDYGLVRYEESQNREDFRAEIMTEIDRLRSETMATLPQPE